MINREESLEEMLLFYYVLLIVHYLPDILYLNKFSMDILCVLKYISIIRITVALFFIPFQRLSKQYLEKPLVIVSFTS